MNTNAIKKIKDFKTLAHFLAEELNWPIDPENVDVDDFGMRCCNIAAGD